MSIVERAMERAKQARAQVSQQGAQPPERLVPAATSQVLAATEAPTAERLADSLK